MTIRADSSLSTATLAELLEQIQTETFHEWEKSLLVKYHYCPQDKEPNEGSGERLAAATLTKILGVEVVKNTDRNGAAFPDLRTVDKIAIAEIKTVRPDGRLRLGIDYTFCFGVYEKIYEKLYPDQKVRPPFDSIFREIVLRKGQKRTIDILGEVEWRRIQERFFKDFFTAVPIVLFVSREGWVAVTYKAWKAGLMHISGISPGLEVEISPSKSLRPYISKADRRRSKKKKSG